MSPEGWVQINLGRISREQAANIVREVRGLWRYLEDVSPQAKVGAKQDQLGQWIIWINGRGLSYLMLFCSKLEKPLLPNEIKQASEKPMPPDFLSGS